MLQVLEIAERAPLSVCSFIISLSPYPSSEVCVSVSAFMTAHLLHFFALKQTFRTREAACLSISPSLMLKICTRVVSRCDVTTSGSKPYSCIKSRHITSTSSTDRLSALRQCAFKLNVYNLDIGVANNGAMPSSTTMGAAYNNFSSSILIFFHLASQTAHRGGCGGWRGFEAVHKQYS